jgi:alpha-glucosidase (family GH31 glycosyl hydrolase)
MILDGSARFTVESPTLIRLEYSTDGVFEDRPTFNVINRNMPAPSYTTDVENGYRVIRTASLTLRYRRGSGPFSAANLSVDLAVGGKSVTAQPSFNVDNVAVSASSAVTPADTNLGGWRRSLDGASGPVRMAHGLLARSGWYLLDDTGSALLNANGRTTPRPSHNGSYQDGHFFGYGHDYRQALKDLHDLTGPAVLLPEWAFGVWNSRYHAYSAADYQITLIPAFRSHQVPLDVQVVDTDWKSPNSWDGWEWNRRLFPDPQAFLAWTKQQDLQVVLNIHPSIAAADPQYAQTVATVGHPMPTRTCYLVGHCQQFDFSKPADVTAFFNLHAPFEAQGVHQWWLDQSNGESGSGPVGVTQDSWVNALYARRADSATRRGFALGRAGGYGSDYGGFREPPTGAWAEHRYTAHFTGDTNPTWSMLGFEAYFTATEGNVGMSNITHDIGGFHNTPADDLYARWVQFGTFQPILRLHSGNAPRLPWEFGAAAEASAEKFLRLREALVPYTYTLARQAYDTGLPIVRSLYLNYPEQDAAYANHGEYLYGDDVLVAPVTTPSTGTVNSSVWFPPGTWTDYFTGRTYIGPANASVTTTLDTMPVFLRAGGILTTRTDYVSHIAESPLTQVTVDLAAGGDGAFTLYEDVGEGNSYKSGASATTLIKYSDANRTLSIGAAQGSFPGMVMTRTWTVRVHGVATAPGTVTVNGAAVTGYAYDPAAATLTVSAGPLSTRAPTTIVLM